MCEAKIKNQLSFSNFAFGKNAFGKFSLWPYLAAPCRQSFPSLSVKSDVDVVTSGNRKKVIDSFPIFSDHAIGSSDPSDDFARN